MSALTVKLPFPPSANDLWTIGRDPKGRPCLVATAKYRKWKRQAALEVLYQRKGARVSGPYGLTIRAGRHPNPRFDLDNAIKPLSDALQNGGAIENDCKAQQIDMAWEPGLEGVRVLVMSTEARA